jgi:hypothetical protein
VDSEELDPAAPNPIGKAIRVAHHVVLGDVEFPSSAIASKRPSSANVEGGWTYGPPRLAGGLPTPI